MRLLVCVSCLAALGCGTPVQEGGDQKPARVAAPSPRRADSDWPRFLGPDGNGTSPETGILTSWPAKGLRVVWQLPAGEGYAMPAISQGRLFLFDRHGDRARLTCRKSTTGESLWSYEYPTDYVDSYRYSGGPRCAPLVDGDRVYLHGVEGMLTCLRVADGSVVWQVDTVKHFGVAQNFFGVGSTPVIEGDLLIVPVGGAEEKDGEAKPNGSAIVAFDKLTGKVRYRMGEELASYSSPVLATIGGRRWGFAFARGGLLGFDPATGKQDFHYPWRADVRESVNAANPVVVGDRVFISETYGPGSALLKVKPGGVEEVWTDRKKSARDKSMQCHWCTPIYRDGYLYGDSCRHPNTAELRCIELATGKVMWRERGLLHTSLLYVDNHFIGLTEDGILLLLNVNSEKYDEVARWEVRVPTTPGKEPEPLEYPCWGAPVLSHGLLYLRSRDRLVCLELIP